MLDYLHDRLGSLELKLGQRRTKEKNNGFMSCSLQVDIRQRGWHKAVLTILKSRQIYHFEMEEDGLFRIYGITDLNELLKSLEKKGRQVSIRNLRHGQCSENIYGPSLTSCRTMSSGLKYAHRRRSGGGLPFSGQEQLGDNQIWPLVGEDTPCCTLM